MYRIKLNIILAFSLFLTACSADTIEKNVNIPKIENQKESAEYSQLLTDTDLQDTRDIAATCYSDCLAVRLAKDNDSAYENEGIESEYTPGNIIVYYVVTKSDRENGNPERKVSIARENSNVQWQIINQGY